MSQTSYGVLFNGYGTCNGYADTLVFLDMIEIKNYKMRVIPCLELCLF